MPLVTDEKARAKVQQALRKVARFVSSPKGEEFPQTSTLFQWYELEEFEAYRQLGYLMGWAYINSEVFIGRAYSSCFLQSSVERHLILSTAGMTISTASLSLAP